MIAKEGSWKAWSATLAVNEPKVMCGLFDREKWRLLKLNDPELLYFDNPYFYRERKHDHFRLIRGGAHLREILPEQPGRKVETPPLEDWRRNGSEIVVIPPSGYQALVYGAHNWLEVALRRLGEATDRKVVVKSTKKMPLADAIKDAWAVVTYGSVAGVEAAIAGVPVFAGPQCPALPISAGALEDIERPRYPEREAWLRSLGYACWKMDDLPNLNLKDYRYARDNNRPPGRIQPLRAALALGA